ncbi:MAG: hypothetical protein ACRD5K_01015 [Candidatus Acidiferrales bacterium]
MASRKTVIGLALVFGIVGVTLIVSGLVVLHRFNYNGFWSLGVCLALVWGLMEQEKRRAPKSAIPDDGSQLKVAR